ncbi:MAG: hypothetical protein J1G38_04010 [Clostridiales bacterium]|nr:hypothetical protein [Clostridiales bacterium]
MDIIYSHKFYDRKDILDLLLKNTQNLVTTNDYKKIVALCGVSGSGKTSILDEYFQRLYSEKHFKYKDFNKLKFFKINLEDRFTPAKILYRIREKIDFNCIQFDYAFLIWWNKTSNMSVIDNSYYNHTQNALFDVLASAGIPYISSFFGLLDVWKKHKPKIKSSFLLNEDEYNFLIELDKKSEIEVLFSLPTLLGRDINKKIGKKNKLVFLIDSFIENMNRENRKWVLKFFDEIPNILMIITSKERLSFGNKTPTIFEQHQIEGLPESFSDEMLLDRINNLSPESRKKIFSFTDGLPRCLELVVSSIENGTMQLGEQDIFCVENMDEFIIAVFNHLSIQLISTIKALAIINVFDEDTVSYFAFKKVEQLSLEERKIFMQSSLLKHCGENLAQQPTFKLFDIVAKTLQYQMDQDEFVLNLQLCRDYIYSSFYRLSADTKLSILLNLEKSIELKHDLISNIEVIELLIDIFLLFVEFGYYSEIYDFLKNSLSKTDEDNEFYSLIEGFCVSKLFGSNKALKCYSRIKQEQRKKFKRHNKTLELLESYSNSLCGNYNKALVNFESIYKSLRKDEFDFWFYAKAKIYYADMLILKGDFKKAISIFNEIKNELYNAGNKYYDYYEIEKQIGHCYRFNFLLDKAESIYESGYFDTNNNCIISLRNYFLTTLLETTCYFNLKKFKHYMRPAYKYNKISGHKNNMAKILYAKGIYNIHLKQFKQSKRYIAQSIKLNAKSKYISGQLFGYISLAYLEYAENGIISNDTFTSILDIIEKINVYRFLLLPIYIIKNDLNKIAELKSQFDWLDFDATVSAISNFVKRLR